MSKPATPKPELAPNDPSAPATAAAAQDDESNVAATKERQLAPEEQGTTPAEAVAAPTTEEKVNTADQGTEPPAAAAGESAEAQPSAEDASNTPPPKKEKKPKDQRHVLFSPEEPKILDLVFHEELTEKEQLENAEFHTRLYADAIEQRKRRMEAHEEAIRRGGERGLDEATFKPAVSKAAQNLPSFENFDQFIQNNEEKTKRAATTFKNKKLRIEAERKEGWTFKPAVSKTSQRIVKNLERGGQYKGPVKGWNKRFSEHLMKQSARPVDPNSHRPFVNRSAAGQQVGHNADETFDRLYEDARTRSAAQRIVERAQRQAEESTLFHPMTNNRCVSLLAESSVDRASGLDLGLEYAANYRDDEDNNDDVDADGVMVGYVEQPSRSVGQVVDALTHKGEEYRQRAAMRKSLADAQLQNECTFTPTTNKKSRDMVRKWLELSTAAAAEVPATDIIAAATNADPNAPSPLRTEFLRHGDRSATTLSPSSKRRGRHTGGGAVAAADLPQKEQQPPKRFDADLFCSRVERRQAEKAKRIEQLRLTKLEQEEAECTFRPAITKVSDEIARMNQRGTYYPDQSLHYHDHHPSQPREAPTTRVLFEDSPKRAAAVSQRQQSNPSSARAPPTARPAAQHHSVERRGVPIPKNAVRPSPQRGYHTDPDLLRSLPEAHRPYNQYRDDADEDDNDRSLDLRFGQSATTPGYNVSGRAGGGGAAVAQAGAADGGVGGGMKYLNELEAELNGVIAEWQHIE